jgi:hypothetical protein
MLAALGTLALGALAVYLFVVRQPTTVRIDAGARGDAIARDTFEPPDGARDAFEPPDVAPDAPPDAARAAPPDAAVDATRIPASIDAGEPPAPGTASVNIGAVPWADITIDGQPRGRTPKTVTLPAGRHVIELIYSGDEPPLREAFTVTLRADQSAEVFHEFKH